MATNARDVTVDAREPPELAASELRAGTGETPRKAETRERSVAARAGATVSVMAGADPNVKICGDNAPRGRRARGRARRMGGGHGLLRREPAALLARRRRARIAAALRRRVELCGVFVNASLEEVAERARELGLTLVQLHGDEGPSFCTEVARRTARA